MKTNVLIFNEYIDEKENLQIKEIYPEGMHKVIGDIFNKDEFNVNYSTLDDINATITAEILANTDVLIWWGHKGHNDVPDNIVKMVTDAVKKGMGFIPLHSSHFSKPFISLTGSACTLTVNGGYREIIWKAAPYHPIARDIPDYFELEQEEVYGEPFDIPNAEDIIFMGWYKTGQVFRSGVTFRRGYGKIFYFQPGHEEYPVYYNETVRRVIKNAVIWAKPETKRNELNCPQTPLLN